MSSGKNEGASAAAIFERCAVLYCSISARYGLYVHGRLPDRRILFMQKIFLVSVRSRCCHNLCRNGIDLCSELLGERHTLEPVFTGKYDGTVWIVCICSYLFLQWKERQTVSESILLLVLSIAFAVIIWDKNVFISGNDSIGDIINEKNRRTYLSGY